jgi:hypothetical protein
MTYRTRHLDISPLSKCVISLDSLLSSIGCFTKRTQNRSAAARAARYEKMQNKPKILCFQSKIEQCLKNKANRITATMKKPNEPKQQNKPKFQFSCSWIPEFLCSWSICTNEPKSKTGPSTITSNIEKAYDIQPSTQDPKKRTQFVPIFNKICAIYPQEIGEILCLRYCGFEFVQNKANSNPNRSATAGAVRFLTIQYSLFDDCNVHSMASAIRLLSKQTDRLCPVIPNPFMGEGPICSVAGLSRRSLGEGGRHSNVRLSKQSQFEFLCS